MSPARLRQRRRQLARLHRRIIIGVPVLVLSIVVGVGVRSLATSTRCGHGCGGPREQAYEIAKSIDIFVLQHGRLPRAIDELVLAPRPIMEQVPRDPWGGRYALIVPGLRNTDRFDVVSAGEDGVFFTADDAGNFICDP